MWGWNDTSALYCADCGKLAADHIVLAPPVFEPIRKSSPSPVVASAAQVLDQGLVQVTRAYQAERAAETKTDLQMLDDSIDPLSIGARTEKANKLRDQLSHAAAPPAEDKQPAARAVAPTTATAQTAPESKVPDDVAALLAREKAYSDSFKDEVERMVRESIAAERRQELDRELDARLPPGPGVASKPAGERDHYGNIKELLEAAGLPQYVEQFEQEAMDSETLYGVMESQGRSALEEVLKELGVNSKGHRMKIANLVAP